MSECPDEITSMSPFVSDMKRLGKNVSCHERCIAFAGGQQPPLKHFMQEHDINTMRARQMTHSWVLASGKDTQRSFIVFIEVECRETMQQNLPQGNRRQRLGPHPMVGSHNLRFRCAVCDTQDCRLLTADKGTNE
jgi:hypothetical protein